MSAMHRSQDAQICGARGQSRRREDDHVAGDAHAVPSISRLQRAGPAHLRALAMIDALGAGRVQVGAQRAGGGARRRILGTPRSAAKNARACAARGRVHAAR